MLLPFAVRTRSHTVVFSRTAAWLNRTFASPLPRSGLAADTLAPRAGNDLNSVAIFENAGGWYAKRGATDARQVRRVGKSRCMSSLSERHPIGSGAKSGV